mmetsp:Transcript_32075/g.90949  ORF Transcript_32075/g.90949 Transcript_32075/m.90949 type:complete len:635 (-) Transcript_32075:296-2200(-)
MGCWGRLQRKNYELSKTPTKLHVSRGKLNARGVAGAAEADRQKVRVAEEAERIETTIKYILLVHSFIHVLQAERGTSTIYAASRALLLKQMNADVMASVDRSWEKLQQSPMFCTVPLLMEAEFQKIREDIKNGDITVDEVQERYNNYIARVLKESAAAALKSLESTGLASVVGPFFIFSNLKENVGRIRARLGGLLASSDETLTEYTQLEIVADMSAMKAHQKSFELTTSAKNVAMLQQLEAEVPREVWELLHKIRQSRLDAQAALATMAPEKWFSLMSARMNGLVLMQKTLVESIRKAAKRHLESDVDLFQDAHQISAVASIAHTIAQEHADVQRMLMNGTWDIPLEQLTLSRELGRGASGSTYSGIWDGHQVAVKVLQDNIVDAGTNPVEVLKEFSRELQALTKLRHPNVLSFLGAAISPPRYCLVLEYMGGGSLWMALRETPETVQFMSMALQLARGMRYIHEVANMIHRDLKSPNLLLGESGQLKVADFGMTMGGDHHDLKGRVGTLRWMAPEVMLDQPYGRSADVYSMGIILWELLTKDWPWRSVPTDEKILPNMLTLVDTGMRPEIPEGTPEAISSLIRDCWHQKPQKRPNCDEILQRLEAAEGGLTDGEKSFLDAMHMGCGIAEYIP